MEKKYIILTGRRNVGKSSLINRLTSQETAIVSDTAGTTTDPVKKAYEIPGYAPVVFIDTAGIDDKGNLGEKKNSKNPGSYPASRHSPARIYGQPLRRRRKAACVAVPEIHHSLSARPQ